MLWLAGSKPAPLGGEQSIGVILRGLFFKIEMSPASRVRSHTGNVLPVTVVTAHVVVDELLFKKIRAIPLVEAELVNQT